MSKNTQPEIKQQMLFRVPVERAFAAFSDPAVTTKFWFSHSTGPLIAGQSVTWEWRPYQHAVSVRVLTIEPNRRIVIQWGDEQKHSRVEWTFMPHGNNATMVTVCNRDFSGFSNEEMVPLAIDSMGGFSLVLANAKAYLEHGIELNLIYDKAPEAIKN